MSRVWTDGDPNVVDYEPPPLEDPVDPQHLPERFWNARPRLAHIRTAAWSRSRSADAVLGAVLARVAALTPPSYRIPAIAGSVAPLNVFVALIGSSGGGKSSSKAVAVELLPYAGTDVADDMPLGSGEGLVEMFFDTVSEKDGTGKQVKVKRQTRHGAFVFLDEGQALAELGARKGSTLAPMLRTAWSGQTLGTSNASAETKRRLAPGAYALGMVIGFQPTLAAALLADTAGGTPQRFHWLQTTDPNLPELAPTWPGPLDWSPPAPCAMHGVGFHVDMAVDDHVASAIRQRARAVTRGTLHLNEFDAHADLATLKVAGLLAILDDRTNINGDDWELAQLIHRTSRTVLHSVIATVDVASRKVDAAFTARTIARELAVDDAKHGRNVERVANSIARHVRTTSEATRTTATRAVAGRDRALFDEALEMAVARKWIVVDGTTYTMGTAGPT